MDVGNVRGDFKSQTDHCEENAQWAANARTKGIRWKRRWVDRGKGQTKKYRLDVEPSWAHDLSAGGVRNENKKKKKRKKHNKKAEHRKENGARMVLDQSTNWKEKNGSKQAKTSGTAKRFVARGKSCSLGRIKITQRGPFRRISNPWEEAWEKKG